MEVCFLRAECVTFKYSNDLWWAIKQWLCTSPLIYSRCSADWAEMQTIVFTLRDAGVLPVGQLKESQQARWWRGRDWWLSWPSWQLAPWLNGSSLSEALVDWKGFIGTMKENNLFNITVRLIYCYLFYLYVLLNYSKFQIHLRIWPIDPKNKNQNDLYLSYFIYLNFRLPHSARNKTELNHFFL